MASAAELKRGNLLELINAIWRKESFTKPELAERTELTGVTVHHAVNEWLAAGFVVEQGAARSNGGRKAALYRMNAAFGSIVGVHVGIRGFHVGVYDLRLELLHGRRCDADLAYNPSVIERLVTEIEAAVRDSGIGAEQVLAVGISLPGQVDYAGGTVLNLTNVPHWRGIPLKRLLEERLGVDVIPDNDNCGTILAAKWLGLMKERADAVYLSIGDGVGTGVMAQGKVVRGKHANVGEIGHMTVDYNGAPCNCGGRGCIETVASNRAVLAKLQAALPQAGAAAPRQLADYVALAREGDRTAMRVFRETAAFVGLALDIAVKAYDPELMIVQNDWLPHFPELFAELVDGLYAKSAWLRGGGLTVLQNPIPELEAIGAAALVKERLAAEVAGNPLLARLTAVQR
ncbi:MAG: ROK family protein [Paenibacillaceae bacterium]|nr:ROK family protein [Paenibacillaceae bacterium]